jgi:hypothetical protein
MKFIAFVVALALFVGGIVIMGYSSDHRVDSAWLFFLGIISVALSLAIPFHLLKRIDR